ncbi:MAG: hypothetical protein WC321_06575 [Candidatus Omnitrophota bacterium]|jgi:hypothetical protein
MGFDALDFLLSVFMVSFYGIICLVCLIFTFSLDGYRKINDRLNVDIFSVNILNPLARNIDWFDAWIMSNHKIIGPILILLSLLEMRAGFYLLDIL